MTRFIVVTGGPGAGKTALLEMARRHFCEHVALLPEAAGIVFGGGFPRRASDGARRAAQRAIYHVQSELQQLTSDEGSAAVALCDRGTLDGLAYWPDGAEDFWSGLGTTSARELARYDAVLLLRTPPPSEYNHKNPLRIETAREAAAIDERILQVWRAHPRLFVLDHSQRFMTKMTQGLELLHTAIGACPICNHRADHR